MGFFGRALGAAAEGYLTGQNRGEGEGFRRQAAAEAIEARREALRLQRHATDPQDKVRAQYGEIAKGLIHVRSDPNMAAFFNDPANADQVAAYDAGIDHALGVAGGKIAVEAADPHLLTFHPKLPGVSVPDTSTGKAAPGAGLGATADQVRANAGLGATAGDVRANAGPQMNLPPLAGPSNVGDVRKEAGLGPGALPFQLGQAPAPGPFQFQMPPTPDSFSTTAPPPAAAPKGPPAPFNPQEEFRRLYEQGPPSAAMQPYPYETPKAFETRKANADKPYNSALTRIGQAITAYPRADILGTDLQTRGEKNRVGIEGTRAGTRVKNEAVRTSQILTPVKKESGLATAAAARARATAIPEQTRQGGQRIAETERHNRATEELGNRNAKIRELAQKDTAGYRRSTLKQKQWVLDHFSEAEIGRDRRAKINALGRIAAAQTSIGPIKGSAAASQGKQALDQLNTIFGDIDNEQKAAKSAPSPAATPVTTTRTTTSGRVSQSGQNRGSGATGAPKVTQGEIQHVRAIRAQGGNVYKEWLAGLPPEARKRAQSIQ